jgi:hypothetical protein
VRRNRDASLHGAWRMASAISGRAVVVSVFIAIWEAERQPVLSVQMRVVSEGGGRSGP